MRLIRRKTVGVSINPEKQTNGIGKHQKQHPRNTREENHP